MDRPVPFGRIVTHVMPHFITRQIFTGAGKVGTEAPGLTSADVPFQLTQRADFFEEEVGLETTLKRPIVNTRDEPHADAQKYRRLHVIVGDANLAEVATFLKVGTTALVLSMIEDDWLTRDLLPAKPVQALRHVSYDMTLRAPDRAGRRHRRSPRSRRSGSSTTGPGSSPRSTASSASAARTSAARCSRRWEAVLTGLETDPIVAGRPGRLGRQAPAASTATASATASRWDDARLAAMDLQYHDLRPEKSLAARVGLERIATDEEVHAGDDRAAARHPGLLPGPVPAALARRASWPPTGTRWCSTSVAIRSAVCP